MKEAIDNELHRLGQFEKNIKTAKEEIVAEEKDLTKEERLLAECLNDPVSLTPKRVQQIQATIEVRQDSIKRKGIALHALQAKADESRKTLDELHARKEIADALAEVERIDEDLYRLADVYLERAGDFRLEVEREVLKRFGLIRKLVGDRHPMARKVERLQSYLAYTEQPEKNLRDLIGRQE